MQNNLDKEQLKEAPKLVGITKEAKSALQKLAERPDVKALSLSQGQVASVLIMRAYEKNETILG